MMCLHLYVSLGCLKSEIQNQIGSQIHLCLKEFLQGVCELYSI